MDSEWFGTVPTKTIFFGTIPNFTLDFRCGIYQIHECGPRKRLLFSWRALPMTPVEAIDCKVTARRIGFRRAASLSLLTAGILLSGCVHTEAPVPQPAPAVDHIGDRLAAAANEASDALKRLSRVEQKRTPAPPAGVDVSKLPPELKVAISLAWNGPVEEALIQISREIGFGFCAAPVTETRCISVVGNRPSSKIIVVLDGATRPAYEILQDISLQLRSRGKLEIDVLNRRMELRYDQR